MAVLSKIREKSLFLIVIIGLALFAFVFDPSTIFDFLNSSKVNEVGQVNGESISREEFAQALENYKAQTGSRVSEMQAAKTVWNNLLRQKVYETQLNEAGITIGEADIMNALYDSPSVKGDARFQTTGIFDKEKLKEHLATIKADASPEWSLWQNYMVSLKNNLQKTTYDNLVGAGLGASLKEGEAQYLTENTKLTSDFVYVPFTFIKDSTIQVTKGEIGTYIKNHASEFQVEETRDINFVKFDIEATPEDEEAIKSQVTVLLNDKEDGGVTIKGLKSTTDYTTFFNENDSETPLNQNIQFKSTVSKVVADTIFKGNKGDVFGPYKDNGLFKISKIIEVVNLPDSVKASHILIPFKGSNSATPETVKTEEEAKITADSLLTVVKANKSKFADLAKEFSADKSNAEKGGDLNWFTYNRMVPAFRDYSFENKTGDMGVVKSQFGFHIIKIDDQKNYQNAVKLATFSKKIEASEETENKVYENAESLAFELSKKTNFDEAVKAKELNSLSAAGLKGLDENVPGIGTERQIVTWAFEQDVNEGDFKRFDVDGGFVVATLTNKAKKGLMTVDKAVSKVRPILAKEKKAAIISKKFTGASLEDIAKATEQRARKANDVNLKSPTISGVGFEPKVVGAMLNAKENELYKPVIGDKGVFAFVVSKKELPTTLPNYDSFRKRIESQRKSKSFQMYEAIKKASDVEDNMSSFYGI